MAEVRMMQFIFFSVFVSILTFDEFLLPGDDLVTEGTLLVVLEYEEVPPPHLVLLKQRLALHLHLAAPLSVQTALLARPLARYSSAQFNGILCL